MLLLALLGLFAARSSAQSEQPDWQSQVRRYCDASDWPSAIRVLEAEIAGAPQDLDLKTWHARILGWSGKLAEAEQEYLEILKVSANDPDNWAGLASVYRREGKQSDALFAVERAVQLDPRRADLRIAHARALREIGNRSASREELEAAVRLDPANKEARVAIKAGRSVAVHELRIGNETDFLSYSSANQATGASVNSRWASLLRTNLAFGAYLRSGVLAEKFTGSATVNLRWLGSLTAGGATADDHAVIPKSETFFDWDHGWKISKATVFRGIELDYSQHWYWYQAARILTMGGTAVLYLPREWSFSLAGIGARSAFSGTGAEWRPSGSARLAFPLAAWQASQLSASVFFAAGTENFASADQIGRFASQTYGGGLRLRLTERQDLNCSAAYQKRTQNKTDTYLGLGYGIRF